MFYVDVSNNLFKTYLVGHVQDSTVQQEPFQKYYVSEIKQVILILTVDK